MIQCIYLKVKYVKMLNVSGKLCDLNIVIESWQHFHYDYNYKISTYIFSNIFTFVVV